MTRPIMARAGYVLLAALTTFAIFSTIASFADRAMERRLIDVPPMPWSQR